VRTAPAWAGQAMLVAGQAKQQSLELVAGPALFFIFHFPNFHI
jgi:hypothetical protein